MVERSLDRREIARIVVDDRDHRSPRHGIWENGQNTSCAGTLRRPPWPDRWYFGAFAPVARERDGMKSYRCYLFDADGTLLDTSELIYRCFVHTVKRYANRDIGRREVQSHIGLTLRAQLELYLGPLDDRRYEEVRAAHMGYQLSIYQQYLRAFPGVAEALACLRDKGCTLGVVTSRMPDTLTLYLQTTGLASYFDLLITPVDTTRHKPYPDPILAALDRLRVEPHDAVYIGDASFDIESGAAAGVDTIFVGWSHNDPGSLVVSPTAIIENPLDLCPKEAA
ncbi:MAG: HAD-IA family hydrolase [Chitinivibrionales bacterium]|nr:HAD-IA family hydrolase [Chitinivibrionales bacterium]